MRACSSVSSGWKVCTSWPCWSDAARPLVQHVPDEAVADQLCAFAGGVHHGNAFVAEHQVAEFVREGPVPGG